MHWTPFSAHKNGFWLLAQVCAPSLGGTKDRRKCFIKDVNNYIQLLPSETSDLSPKILDFISVSPFEISCAIFFFFLFVNETCRQTSTVIDSHSRCSAFLNCLMLRVPVGRRILCVLPDL